MKWARVSVILALGLAGCTTLRVAPLPSVVADDGAAWAQVLQRSVDGMGQVDFRGLQAMPQALERAVALVGETRPEKLPSDAARITFHLNAYNLLAMFNVVRSGIPERLSLEDRVRFFKRTSVVVGGEAISLYDYENDVIHKLGDPRVHFALNCMAVSCPRLPRVPFEAARLFFSEARNVAFDAGANVVRFSSILDFYPEDFLRVAPSLVAYANRYRAVLVPEGAKVEFIAYDWTINRQPGAPS
jgi:hypothetical protein